MPDPIPETVRAARFIFLCLLLVLVTFTGCGSEAHHWEHITGKQAEPYTEQYFWVNDKTGRTDDCHLTHESNGEWSLWIHGQGYGDFNSLENAQQACYRDFERFYSWPR
jgi:hypothetical protein